MERPVTFESEGSRIVGILHVPDGEGAVPGVVLCHGFTGTKCEAHFIFVKLARRLAAEGIAALRFDFRGSGDSDGRFEDMTISGEIADAERALAFLASQSEVDRSRIGILGLSLGGCVAAVVAGSSSLVAATVLWSPVDDPDVQFSPFAGRNVAFPYECAPGMLLGRAFVDELPQIDPVRALAATHGPVLILHGTNDQAVPYERSAAYKTALDARGIPCERTIIDGADHTFGGVSDEAHVIERTTAWLKRHLKAGALAPKKVTYAQAGVNIEAANRTKGKLRELVRRSRTPHVLTDIGGFGGLFDATFEEEEPILVASTDGVGTKLKVAVMAGKHDTVGGDLVNHCVNDILVMGARPLFFMDYIALGRHASEVVVELVGGLARACADAGCALLGGETAEMPDMYRANEYDLAGTIVGVVERRHILHGDRIGPGDVILGIGSDGLHTNGYSLARKLCFEQAGWTVDTYVEAWKATVGEALLWPHRSYFNALFPLLEDGLIRGMAHVTGGGITDNLPRILPDGVAAEIDLGAWPVPPLFTTLVAMGRMETEEAYRTFNMGIGMVAVVAAEREREVTDRLIASGERVWRIGKISPGEGQVHYR